MKFKLITFKKQIKNLAFISLYVRSSKILHLASMELENSAYTIVLLTVTLFCHFQL